ncbi:MAG: hypothetical protein ALAOOOJD_02966 [bacterium]|nr:hypothetical protein [bacterium]
MQEIVADDRRRPPRRFGLAQIVVVLSLFLVITAAYIMPAKRQPESTNIIGYFDFKFKTQHLKNVSQPWRYTWHNSETVACVEQVNSFFAGKGKLLVYDGAGNEVYAHRLGADGVCLTNSGVAGEWTIMVVFDHEAN